MKFIFNKTVTKIVIALIAVFSTGTALAATDLTIGGMAEMITQSFANITKMITAGSYLAGLGFSMGAVMKFRQHKDNPTQIPVGTPIAMLFVASSLLFFPTILGVTGETMFGGQQEVAGPLGTIF